MRKVNLRKLVLGLAAVLGLLLGLHSIYRVCESFEPQHIYRRDLFQDYLIARAVVSGINPYLSTDILAEHFFGPIETQVFKHPSPHPPTVVPFILYMGLLDYRTAAISWCLLEALFLFSTIVIIIRSYLNHSNYLLPSLLVFFIALGAQPISQSLIIGQFSIINLFLATLSLLLALRRKDHLVGLTLALSFSIKAYSWPLLLFFALKRRFKVLFSFIAYFTLIALITIAIVPDGALLSHFEGIVGMKSNYAACDKNISIWTLSQRLFGGLRPGFLESATSHPLLNWPWGARFLGPLFPITVLVISLRRACSLDFVSGYLLIASISVILSPIAWTHGLSIALFPLMLLAGKTGLGFSPTIFACMAFLYFGETWRNILYSENSTGFFNGQLGLIPVVALIFLLFEISDKEHISNWKMV